MRLPLSPHDTFISGALRFVLELAALFLIGQAFGVINFLVSVAAIALFNVKGDKKFIGVQVSGPIRLMIEVVVALMGIYGAGVMFGGVWAAVLSVVWLVYLGLGRERLVWLAKGARSEL